MVLRSLAGLYSVYCTLEEHSSDWIRLGSESVQSRFRMGSNRVQIGFKTSYVLLTINELAGFVSQFHFFVAFSHEPARSLSGPVRAQFSCARGNGYIQFSKTERPEHLHRDGLNQNAQNQNRARNTTPSKYSFPEQYFRGKQHSGNLRRRTSRVGYDRSIHH